MKLRFKHLFAKPELFKFENVISTNIITDSFLIKGNPKYLAYTTPENVLAVLDGSQPKKLGAKFPKIMGHAGAILDFDFYPFNDQVIATAAEDSLIKCWEIPENFENDLTEPVITLKGHERKVNLIKFNETTEYLLASASYDGSVKIWDCQKSLPALSVVTDTAVSLEWNSNGSLLGLTTKNKEIKVVDPRGQKIVFSAQAHQGSKPQKMAWANDKYLVSTGFSKQNKREIFLWNLANTSKPEQIISIDSSSGVLFPFFDQDTNNLFLVGKGDGNIRFFEYVDNQLHFTNLYQSTVPATGFTFYPKRCVDVQKHEIMRGLKLTNNTIEFLSFIMPRKIEGFQEDLYPPCSGATPALKCNEWLSGKTSEPIKISLKPKGINEQITISKAIFKVEPIQDSSPNKEEIVNQFDTVDKDKALKEKTKEILVLKKIITEKENDINSLKQNEDVLEKTIKKLNKANEALSKQLEQQQSNVTVNDKSINTQEYFDALSQMEETIKILKEKLK